MPSPRLVKFNVELVRNLGWIRTRSQARRRGDPGRNHVAVGPEPLAIAYAGHQFRHFVPQLGDGRANLLGEVSGRDGVRYDFSSRVPAGPLSPAAGTAEPRWVRFCASTS